MVPEGWSTLNTDSFPTTMMMHAIHITHNTYYFAESMSWKLCSWSLLKHSWVPVSDQTFSVCSMNSWNIVELQLVCFYLRNACLFSGFCLEWIAVRDKQIAWTAKRFSDDLLVPRSDWFPMNPENRQSFHIFTMLPSKNFMKFPEKSYQFKLPTE